MVRATLLYDTVAARIDSEVDRFVQYNKFLRFREHQARKRFRKNVGRRAKRGPDDTVYLRLDEIAKTSDILMNRAQTMLSSPVLNFGSLVGKWVFTLSTVIKLLGRIFLVTALAAVILAGVRFAGGNDISTTNLLLDVITKQYKHHQSAVGSDFEYSLPAYRGGVGRRQRAPHSFPVGGLGYIRKSYSAG
jgi:hypothetical protein